MDIEKALLEEHSKKQTLRIVKYVGADKKRFKTLLDVMMNGEYRITQRAAWPFSYIAAEHPELIKPHLASLIKKLEENGHHPSIPRNILRTFQEIEIPEKYHGTLVDICLRFITGIKNPTAIRAFSITVAAQICRNYPELRNELNLIFDEMRKFPQDPAIAARLKSAGKLLA